VLKIPRDSTLKRLEEKALAFTILKTLRLPRTLEFIHGSALYGVSNVSMTSGSQFGFDGLFVFDALTVNIICNFDTSAFVKIASHFGGFGDSSFYRSKTVRGLVFDTDCRVRTFEKACFAKSMIQSLRIPRFVELLGERCFYSCISLAEVTFEMPSRVKRIEAEALAQSAVKSICIPQSVVYIHGSAVRSLEMVMIEGGNRTLRARGHWIVGADRKSLIAQLGQVDIAVIPQPIEVIGPGCFEGRNALLSMKFRGVKFLRTIDERAFARSSLAEMAIPPDIEVIGSSAFEGCQWLKKVTFGEKAKLYHIGAYGFWGTAVSEFCLPASITAPESHCLPTDCHITMASSEEVPEFIEWRRSYLADPDSVMSRVLDSDLTNVSEILFHIEDYERGVLIGSGAFAHVYKYVHKRTHVEVAVKTLFNFSLQNEQARLQFIREVAILRGLEHRCVVPLVGVCLPTANDSPLIAMLYMPGGSLESAMRDTPSKLTPTARAIIAAGIVLAMIYIHAQNIMHRDLTPATILLDAAGRPLIADFGLSTAQDSESNAGGVGSPFYMAPECFDDDAPPTTKVDVYAFAILLFELVTGQKAFNIGQGGYLKHVTNIARRVRPKFPSSVSPAMRDLMSRGWAHDAAERLSFPEVFECLTRIDLRLWRAFKSEKFIAS
jgi:tRNA A-37 threonylcarbamoyl transferase component Bud32